MNKYLDSIQLLESVGTGVSGQAPPDIIPVLEMSGDAPTITYASPSTFSDEIGQDSISYSAPQKVIVRTYRLRK